MSDTPKQLHDAICREAGVPLTTSTDAAIEALTAKWDARAAAVGVPVGSAIPDILAAERKAKGASKLAAALQAASGPAGGAVVGGVRLLTREEGEEILNFSLDSPLLRRRVEATEAALGKDLRQALQDGDLR